MTELSIPVPISIQVPREAYRYWPVPDDICRGKEKKSVRFIFEFQSFTDFEKEKLSRLLKEIKNGHIEGLKIPEDWTENHLLRFCYGTGWKTRNAVKTLVSHLQWRNSSLKNGYISLYPKALNLLNSGVFYVHGRDCKFRPLIVMNFAKINFKEHSVDDYTNVLCFLLEYIVNKMLLPGQIENWVVLTDLGKNGLGNLSISSLKQVLHILQANYRCRLGVNYIINPPKSIWVLWSCIKPFLDEITIDKIKISNASYSQEMLSLFNPYQVEEKFGGKAPNLVRYWPPTVPETNFTVDGKPMKLSEKDSYYVHKPPVKEITEESQGPDERPLNSVPSRANSMDLGLNGSELEVNDLDNDFHARSDLEDQEENLVDFEEVSPFTRKNTRNPTFVMTGFRCSEDFQKKISMKSIHAEKINDQDESQEISSLDFDADPTSNPLFSTMNKKKDEVCLIEDAKNDSENSGFCSFKKIECSIVKDSCDIL